MPHIDDEVLVPAPLEEVWKLVHDPSRYPEWWTGIGSVEPAPDGFTMYPDGWPDYPMPQRLSSSSADGRVTISLPRVRPRVPLAADRRGGAHPASSCTWPSPRWRQTGSRSRPRRCPRRSAGWPGSRPRPIADDHLSIPASLARHPGVRLDRATTPTEGATA